VRSAFELIWTTGEVIGVAIETVGNAACVGTFSIQAD